MNPKDGKWRYFNDLEVVDVQDPLSFVNRQNVAETPYILFYKLKLTLIELNEQAVHNIIETESIVSSTGPPATKLTKEELRRKQSRESKQRQRLNEEMRLKERISNQERMRLVRADEERVQKEREANLDSKRLTRLDEEKRNQEKIRNPGYPGYQKSRGERMNKIAKLSNSRTLKLTFKRGIQSKVFCENMKTAFS